MASGPTTKELCETARAALKKRDARGAIAAYEQAIEKDERHVDALEGLAMVHFLLKDYDKAIELFQKVTRIDPRASKPHTNMGAIYNRKKDYQAAVKSLRSALAKDRMCPESYYNLGIAQKGLNQLGLATSAYKEAIRLNPEMASAHANLGNVYIEMKNFRQAKLCFERALDLDPNFKRALAGMRRAEQISNDQKNSMSPFGRLVDMEEVKRKNEAGDVQYRELNSQERYDDRNTIHKHAKAAEQRAQLLLDHLRDQLGQSLLELNRVANEKDNPQTWAREIEAFEQATQDFKNRFELLKKETNNIRTHEAMMRSEKMNSE